MSRIGSLKLLFLLTLTLFAGQVVLGCVTGSLALVAESFHSLSVSICLYVTLYSNKLAKKQLHSTHFTYGWKRTELLGTLLNGVLLLALSFAIFLNVFQRCFELKVIEKPEIVFIIGSLSLVMNLISLSIFRESPLLHLSKVVQQSSKYLTASSTSRAHFSPLNAIEQCQYEETTPLFLPQFHRQEQLDIRPTNFYNHQVNDDSKNQMWYFYHLLSSTFGSIILLITSGITWGTGTKWGFLGDLMGGLIIALVHFTLCVSVVQNACTILMQGLPNAIPFDLIRGTINKIPGVLSVHEFHLWQLNDTTTAASVRVRVINATSYSVIERNVQEILQSYGIHSFTIEPEFMNSYRDVLTRTTKEKVEIPRPASVDNLTTLGGNNKYCSVSANIPTPSTKTKLGRDSIINYYQRQQQHKQDQPHLYPFNPEYRKLTIVGSPQPHRTNSSFF